MTKMGREVYSTTQMLHAEKNALWFSGVTEMEHEGKGDQG